MTITLDIKEILEYEKAMVSWGTSRATATEKMLSDYRHSPNSMPNGPEGVRRSVMDWDRNNPPPTLIPKI